MLCSFQSIDLKYCLAMMCRRYQREKEEEVMGEEGRKKGGEDGGWRR